MKVTLADIRASRIPASIGACPTDDRLLQIVNEALERLMYEGKWFATTARFRFCAVDSCITMPPQIATIESVAICGQPVTLRTQWWEYVSGGMGIQSDSNNGGCCGGVNSCGGFGNVIYRGHFTTFGDVQGTNKKVALVCDLASDVGKTVLVLGYDANGNWIRTNQGGTILDGEIVTLAQNTGTISNSYFSAVTDIQFPDDRDGQIWLYEYNTGTMVKRLIGQYQNWETRPSYARYFFPSIQSGSNSDGGCSQTLVELIGKLNYTPLVNDSDYACIPCIPAIKEMVQALNNAENETDGVQRNQIIAAGMTVATKILDQQLNHFTGSGNKYAMNIAGSGFENDPIVNLV